ncbi:unnamed protein product [Thlaspi arvense]|uniref:BTB domain-containing protein n=1 Tax=Thlaspi arvense TaxID=13288 RepID=A0AAU9SF38_THLAR|nr:unnamed protein product [Thlaspi arvense]
MDCSICTTMPSILRPPRNTICGSCYEGARTTIALLKKLEGSKEDHDKFTDKSTVTNGSSLSSSPLFSCEPQPLEKVIKWMKNMKETEEEQKKRIVFLSSFVSGFKEQLHADILLKPGDDGPPIPAHRALLASKSEIFKNVLDSDECKTAPEYAITLQELNSQELQALLEFLYTGTLASDKLEKHVYALFVAADKYMIHYLQEFCEQHMLSTLDISSVLDVLDVSDLGSSKMLKEAALGFVVRNIDEIVFSEKENHIGMANMDLFHDGLVKILKEKYHPDVKFLAGDDDHEDPIPAHRIIMGARSDFLKELCEDNDYYKEKPIILYEMNHEELEAFVEFMYVGDSIQPEKLKKHARSLYLAADLYKVPLLRELCRYQLMSSLNTKNALDIFELSKDDPHEKPLHDKARGHVISHMKEIVLTQEFKSFVERNPSLTVELIRVLTLHGGAGRTCP